MNGRLRKMIRQDAKQALAGKWLTAIIIWFILTLVTAPSTFTFHQAGQRVVFDGNGISILLILLSAPLLMGATKWYLSMLRREDVAIEQVFSWFTKERYLPSLMVRLFFFMVRIIQMIVIVLIGLLSLIPMFALGGFAFYSHNGFRGGFNFMPFAAPDYFFNIPRLAGSFVLCAILFILVVLAATVFTEWFITRYSAVTNIVADTPQIGIGPAIRQSLDVMEGNGWKMIRFYLSFIGWALLIPITFGLILLYLVPYFTASRLLYIEYFRDMHNKRIAGTPSFERPDQSPPDPEPKPEENGPQNPPEQGQ